MLLYQILESTTHGKIKKKSYKNNKVKSTAPKQNEKLELPSGLYSVSDIQDYFEYIMKRHDTFTD